MQCTRTLYTLAYTLLYIQISGNLYYKREQKGYEQESTDFREPAGQAVPDFAQFRTKLE